MLFLHGWGCSLETMRPLIDKFKGEFRCICVDFFGHGKSPEMPYPLSVFDFAFACCQILEKLKIDTVSIVAHSFGARVAFIIASQKNVKVEKMVLFGPAGLKPKFSLVKFLKKTKFKLLKFFCKIGLYKKEKLARFGSEDYRGLSPVGKRTFINIISCDLKIFLPLIEAKTLVVIGENDKDTPIYIGRKICKKIKNSRLEIVPNAGHFAFLEKMELKNLAYFFVKC